MSKAKEFSLDLAAALGASTLPSVQTIILYICNKDQDGNPVKNYAKWVKEGKTLATALGGGSTTSYKEGTWKNRQTGRVIFEKTALIEAFLDISDPEMFNAQIAQLRVFLHRFGRQTNQGEVRVEVAGVFWSIQQYDNG